MDSIGHSIESKEDLSPLIEKINKMIQGSKDSQEKGSKYLANVKNTPLLLKNYFQNNHSRYSNELYSSPNLQHCSKSNLLRSSDTSATLTTKSSLQNSLNQNVIRDCQTNYNEIDPVKVTEMFQEPGEFVEQREKLPYLKKSNFRRLKRFNKKSELNSYLPQKEIKLKSVLIKPNSMLVSNTDVLATGDDVKSVRNHDRLNAFERLEEKVAHQSFISTSSSVNELLYEEDKFSCSSPISTPDRNRTNMSHDKRLIKFHKNVSNDDPNQGSLQNCTPKVKFQQNGAKVLEFDIDDSPNVIQNQSAYSDDSVINVSDIENLALLGFNCNIVHELTTTEQIISNFNDNCDVKSHTVVTDVIQKHIIGRRENESSKVTSVVNNIDMNRVNKKSTVYASKTVQMSAVDDDLRNDKILLQARTYELEKEIKRYQAMSKEKENQTKEFEKLKLQHETRPNIPKKLKKQSNLMPVNIGPMISHHTVIAPNDTKHLNDAIRLKNENCDLKKKISFLQKELSGLRKREKSEHNSIQPSIEDLTKLEKLKSKFSRPTKTTITSLPKSKIHSTVLKDNSNMKTELSSGSSHQELQVETLIPNKDSALDNDYNLQMQDTSERTYKKDGINLYDAYNSDQFQIRDSNMNMFEAEVSPKNYNSDNDRFRRTMYPDRTVIIYKKDNSVRTIYKDGKEVRKFSNGQVETYMKDGTFHILSPDKSNNIYFKDGSKRHIASDGTKTNTSSDGEKEIEYPNGITAICTANQSKWSFPDGTVKIEFNDGSTETSYPNGKVRFKSKEGLVSIR